MRQSPNRDSFNLDVSRGDSAEIEEIISCPLCKGYGSWGTNGNSQLIYGIPTDKLTPEDTCDKCDGTGRLIITTKVKFRAFDSKKSLSTQIIRNPENVI